MDIKRIRLEIENSVGEVTVYGAVFPVADTAMEEILALVEGTLEFHPLGKNARLETLE